MVGIVRGFLASLFSDSDSNHGRLASVSIWGSEANGPVSPRTFHDGDSYLNSPRRKGILSTFPSPTPLLTSQCSALIRCIRPFCIKRVKGDCVRSRLSAGFLTLWILAVGQTRSKALPLYLYPAATHRRASARGRVPRLAIESPAPARTGTLRRPYTVSALFFFASITEGSV
jgi:hypothetical protein